MTPQTFRDQLDRLGLSQLEAARWLDVDARTVRRWCDTSGGPNVREVPPPVRRLLALAEAVPEARQWLASER